MRSTTLKRSKIRKLKGGIRSWVPLHQPTVDRPLRAEWGPPQANGWYPKLTNDGKWIAYGFWQTFVGNLHTGETREILAPTGARLFPLGFIDNVTLIAVTEAGPAATYAVSMLDFSIRDLGVPAHHSVTSWGYAANGHYALNAANQTYCVKDGQPFRTDVFQYGCTIDGDHLVTSNKETAILHFRGNDLVRQLPMDNQWIVNQHGDILTGYYGRVKLYRHDNGDRMEDATIAPWGTEGAAGALVRDGNDLWIWTPTCGGDADECWIIGRRLGEVDPIVLDIPAVATAAILVGSTWIIAGADAKGRLKVMWCPKNAPRTKLKPKVVDPVDPIDPPPPPPENKMFRNFEAYVTRRWNELGVPEKTAAVTRQLKPTGKEKRQLRILADAHKAAETITGKPLRVGSGKGKVSKRTLDLEEAYKAVQCPAIVQIAGELHHAQGNADVGLSTKNSGNHWPLPDGRKVATDIITIKPTVDGKVVAGNFSLVDVVVSVGSPEARPAWSVLGENQDASRPWMLPPTPDGVDPDEPDQPEPTDTHRYIGGGNDTGWCDVVGCAKPVTDPVHRVPEGLIPHTPWQGEDGKGDCDLCARPVSAAIHQTQPPPPDPKPVCSLIYTAGDRGNCFNCGNPVIKHQQEEPVDEPIEYHEPVPMSRKPTMCAECGELVSAPIHQKPVEPGGDQSAVVAGLTAILAQERLTTAAIDQLRADMNKQSKDLIAAIKGIKLVPFGKAKK